jgi:secondary thiamine-phosphate synthase enzyme
MDTNNRKTVKVVTEKQFIPLNKIVEEFVRNKKGEGLVHIFARHTTCAIRILENEILLLADINNYLSKVAPEHGGYMHDKIEIRDVPITERVNAYSHLRQLHFQASELIPVSDGTLILGKWQTIFLVELDPIREREIIMSYLSL